MPGLEGSTLTKLMAAALAAVITVGCASQEAPAQLAIGSLEHAVAAAQPDIEKFAADQLAGVTAAVAGVKTKFDAGDFAGVIADVPVVTASVSAAAAAAAEKKAALTADWGSFAAMPAMVGQLTAKLADLSGMRRLPAGMTKTTLDDAKGSLEKVTALWTEASGAFEKGDLIGAVAKAKDVKPMVDTLMTTLGLTAMAAK